MRPHHLPWGRGRRVRRNPLRNVGRASDRPNRPLIGYPPPKELAALWGACVPCGLDDEVSALLARHGLCAEWVDDFHLARALPPTVSLPAWASFRRARPSRVSWIESGHRLLVPIFDALGRMRSVRAWCVREHGRSEARVPRRLRVPAPRSRLRSGCRPALGRLGKDGWAATTSRRHHPGRARFSHVGDAEFRRRRSGADRARRVGRGVVGRFARRIPDGARVFVRTHHDRRR